MMVKNPFKRSGILLLFIGSFLSLNAQQNNCAKLRLDYRTSYLNAAASCGAPSSVTFQNKSGRSAAKTAVYKWYINDSLIGQSRGLKDINFSYSDTGVYQLKLVGFDSISACTDSLEVPFLVFNKPVPTIISSVDTVCAGSMVYFNATVQDSWQYSTYSWRFPDNLSSDKSSTSFLFTKTGNQRLRLKVNNTANCDAWATKNIFVTNSNRTLRLNDLNGNPSSNPIWENCIRAAGTVDTFQLILTTPDSVFNYTLDFGDGTSINGGTDTFMLGDALYHTYKNLGTYSLTLKGEDANGCRREVRGIVINERIPTAGIIGPPSGNQSGCAPLAVRFINNSYNISNSTTFTWTFGDGESETLSSGNAKDTVWHTYKKDASDCDMEVTLSADNACGTSIATWAYVDVFDEDDVSLSANSGTICAPDSTITLTVDIDRNCVGGQRFYYWDFGDGRSSGWTTTAAPRTVIYKSPGTYQAMVIDSNTCGADTALYSITVREALQNGFTTGFTLGNANNCAPVTIQVVDTSTGVATNSQWNFGNGSTSSSANPSTTYNSAGIYPISLSRSNECETITTIDTVVVYGKPEAQIANIDSMCYPAVVRFINQTPLYSANATFLWTLPDNSTSTLSNPGKMTITNPGNYTVSLIVSDSCGADTVIQNFRILDYPTASFSAVKACEGNPTSFSNSSSINANDGNIASYKWLFGDGNSSSTKNPSYVYKSDGNYAVTLMATSNNGCIDTLQKQITVFDQPSIQISQNGTSYCPKVPINFNALVNLKGALVDSINWDFGDGNESSDSTIIQHSYSKSGTYRVLFWVGTNQGCYAEDSILITINPNPIAQIVADTICHGDSTTIIDLGNAISRNWDLNLDGIIDAQKDSFKWRFNKAGLNTATIILTSVNGCTIQDSFQVQVSERPIAQFSQAQDSICQGDSLLLTNGSSNTDSSFWYKNSASVYKLNNSATLGMAYDSSGIFQLTLVTKNIAGCSDTTNSTVTVVKRPIASFTYLDTMQCAPFQIALSNTSQNANSFQWLVDGALFSSSIKFPGSSILDDNENSIIALVANNSLKCHADTFIYNFKTYANPVAAFTESDSNGCGPLTVAFKNQSKGATSYYWDFGNGDTSWRKDPSSIFLSSALQDSFYHIKMVAVSVNKCLDSVSDQIQIFPAPKAIFSTDKTNGCAPLNVSFTNASLAKDTSTINDMRFLWDFNNGVKSKAIDTLSSFNEGKRQDSVYRVKLKAFSEHGCMDSMTKEITVYPTPKVQFSSNLVEACHPLQVRAKNISHPKDTGNIAIMGFNWKIGTATSNTVNQQLKFNNTGLVDSSYLVQLVGTSEHGCIDSASQVYTVHPNPVAKLATTDSLYCRKDSIFIYNQSVLADTSYFNYGDALKNFKVKGTAAQTKSYKFSGYYNISLRVETKFACEDHDTLRIGILEWPEARFNSPDTIGCAPFSFSYNNNSRFADSFLWLKNDVLLDKTLGLSSQQAVVPSDSFVIKLVAKNRIGCRTDTALRVYRTYKNPDVAMLADTSQGCGNSTLKFRNLTRHYSKLLWSFGDGSQSTKRNPKHNFIASATQDTSFIVKLVASTKEFCTDSISDTITLFPIPKVDFLLSDSNGCGPLQVQFKNQSSPLDTGSIKIMRFEWDLGNSKLSNLESPTTRYLASKTADSLYTVKLIGYSEHNCIDSASKTIRVFPNPTISFTPTDTNGCQNLGVSFLNNSSPNDTGSISDMSFVWHSAGITYLRQKLQDTFTNYTTRPIRYLVVLKGATEHGCLDSSKQVITVFPSPKANFSLLQDSSCRSDSFEISNLSVGAESFHFNWGNGKNVNTTSQSKQRFAYQKSGEFEVNLRVFNSYNCRDSISKNVHSIEWPKAIISSKKTSGCAPQDFSFKNQSQQAVKYQWWQNGKQVSDSSKVPNIMLKGPLDSALLYLIAENALSCHNDTTRIKVKTFANPKAIIETDTSQGCGPLSVQLGSKSLLAFNQKWHLEKGIIDLGQRPKHTFSASKSKDTSYVVKLLVQTINGCKDSIEKLITVFPKPKVHFVPSTNAGCGPLSVRFKNHSSPLDTGSIRIMSFNWDFGNGSTSKAPNPNSVFTASRRIDTFYQVKLKAYTEHACVDSSVQSIQLYSNPSLKIAPTVKHGCGPLKVQFLNLSRPNDVSSIFDMKFRWNYGNGDTSTKITGSSVFNSPVFRDTIYNVSLVGFTEHLCHDSISVPIKVHPNPVANFKPSQALGCSPHKVAFANLSSPNDTGGLANMNFIWEFENGIISRAKTPNYTYYNFGGNDTTHSIKLIAISKWNCNDTISKNVTIHHLPKADFNVNEMFSCSPLQLETQNTSQNADSFAWSIGKSFANSSFVLRSELQSTIKRDSIFEISLKAITDEGCSASTKRNVMVFRQVKAEFLAGHKGCTPYTAEFINQSKNAVINEWDFGNGFGSNEPTPKQRFLKEGSYKVSLKVTDITGCSDSTEMPSAVDLKKTPDARISLDTLVNELPDAEFNMQPTVWVSDGTVKYKWKTAGKPTNASPTNRYIFNNKGEKEIWLTATTSYCQDSTKELVDVILPFPEPGFNSDLQNGCVALEVMFTDTSQWAEEVEWFFGDGKSSKERNPKHIYQLPGTYKVSQKVINERGQKFVVVDDYIEVYPLPYVDFDPTPKVVFLPDADVTFNNLSINAIEYEWYAEDIFFSNDTTPSMRFVDEGVYDIMLVGNSDMGCIDTVVHENLVKVRAKGDAFVASGFTPDGDGRNDGFKPIGYGIESEGYNFQVFNRWGQKIFETDDKNEMWDGTYNGVECKVDVYVWVVRLEFAHEEIRYEAGNVTLVR